MKRIYVNRKRIMGMYVTVDDSWYLTLLPYNWSYDHTRWDGGVSTTINGKRIFMKRIIMGCDNNNSVIHLNKNRLDLTTENLRVISDNRIRWTTRKTKRKTSSIYKGVCYMPDRKRYRSCIMKDRKTYVMGYFVDEIEAAKAYDKKALELFGDIACLNFEGVS